MSSAICFNLVEFKILSSGRSNGLSRKQIRNCDKFKAVFIIEKKKMNVAYKIEYN